MCNANLMQTLSSKLHVTQYRLINRTRVIVFTQSQCFNIVLPLPLNPNITYPAPLCIAKKGHSQLTE